MTWAPVGRVSMSASEAPVYVAKRWRTPSTSSPAMKPVNAPVSQGMRATESVNDVPGRQPPASARSALPARKWFDCAHTHALGKLVPQSFSM